MACNKFLNLSNGQKLPVVGLGTWQATDSALEQALEVAFEAGYRYFDTGIFYANQHIIGSALSRWISDGKATREDILISSTFSIMGVENIELQLNMTLQNLQTDYIDLFLIQFPVGVKFNPENFKNYQFEIDVSSDIIAVWKKLEDFVKAGKVKGIGMCSFTSSQIMRVLNEATILPTCIEIEVHPMLQHNNLINLCKKYSIGVIGFSPLGSPNFNDFMDVLGVPRKELPNVLNNKRINEIAKKYSKSAAQIVLRYAVQRGIAVIPKSITPERIKENIDIFDFSLDGSDMDIISSLDEGPRCRIVDYAVFPQFKNHPEYPF